MAQKVNDHQAMGLNDTYTRRIYQQPVDDDNNGQYILHKSLVVGFCHQPQPRLLR